MAPRRSSNFTSMSENPKRPRVTSRRNERPEAVKCVLFSIGSVEWWWMNRARCRMIGQESITTLGTRCMQVGVDDNARLTGLRLTLRLLASTNEHARLNRFSREEAAIGRSGGDSLVSRSSKAEWKFRSGDTAVAGSRPRPICKWFTYKMYTTHGGGGIHGYQAGQSSSTYVHPYPRPDSAVGYPRQRDPFAHTQ